MKKPVSCVIACFILVFFCLPLHAEEEAVKPVLSKGDLTRFIKTFPDIVQDLQTLGTSFDGVTDPSALQAIAANEEVQSILGKYGWNEEFYAKMMAITMGYAQTKFNEQLAQMPADQRAMMEQMLKQQMPDFGVHAKDLALIEPYTKQLKKLFDSLD